MDTGLYVAAIGGLQKEDWLDAHSNNMANIYVPGFKRDFQVYELFAPSAQENIQASGQRLPISAFSKEELEAEDTTVLQNNLEMSNASIVEEMLSMITALRSYETHMKLIKEFDEITDKAVSLNREAGA